MVSVAWLLVLLLFPLVEVGGGRNHTIYPSPNCRSKCGGVSIDYPFGIGSGCFLAEAFEVGCHEDVPTLVRANTNTTTATNTTTKTTTTTTTANLILSEIRLTDHVVQLRSNATMAVDCRYEGPLNNVSRNVSIKFQEPFTVSAWWNRFRAMGCDTKARIVNDYESFVSQCETQWMLDGTQKRHGGLGQCQIAVPGYYTRFDYNVTNEFNYKKSACAMRCSFAVLVEASFNLSASLLDSYNESSGGNVEVWLDPIPLVAEWQIDGICPNDSERPVCGVHAYCSNSSRGSGHHCHCNEGFSGNPYLPEDHPGACRDGGGPPLVLVIALAGGFVLAATLGASSYSYGSWAQKKKLAKIATRLLEELNSNPPEDALSPPDDPTPGGDVNEFSAPETETGSNPEDFNKEDLKKVIKGLQKGRRIAMWARRYTVFKANLAKQGRVEIRKYSIQDKTQLRPFMIGVRTLTRSVVHANVARLVGISTREHSLVYKHFSDQTLFDRLHRNSTPGDQTLSWEERLKIATGTARGLAFAHSKGIFHRNVKSSNILLDESCNPKVVDLGVARLWRRQTLLNTSRGYVDPEYLNQSSYQLTAKSDVYSFGVVLVELLTGQNPSSKGSNRGGKTLTMRFVSMVEEGRLDQVVDKSIGAQERIEQLQAVADVATQCLQLKGEGRPNMDRVRDLLVQKGGQPQGQNVGRNNDGSRPGQNDDIIGRFESAVDKGQSYQDKLSTAIADEGDELEV